MKKILSILIVSMVLVSCGNKEANTDVIVVPESSTTTSTGVREETTTTSVHGDPLPTTTTKPGAKAPAKPVVVQGGQIGRISISAIGLDQPVFEGIDLSILNKGPGHYPHSPKPCRAGNAAIAGHRTTYTKPFNGLDLLKDGDIISISTPEGDCSYKYLRTEIVSPSNVSVVMPKDNGANLLTLTACHPKGSAAKRIVITASLISVNPK